MFLLIGRSRHPSIENIAQLLETASEDSALITLEALHQVFQSSTFEFLDPCARLCAQVYMRHASMTCHLLGVGPQLLKVASPHANYLSLMPLVIARVLSALGACGGARCILPKLRAY